MKPTAQLSAFFANVAQTSLEPMGLTPVPRRCQPCRQAAWLVLEDWPVVVDSKIVARAAVTARRGRW